MHLELSFQKHKKLRKPFKIKAFGAFFFGTAEGTRTPNIQNRNLTLYPLNYGRILRSIFSMRSVIIAGIFQNVKGIFHFWGIFFPTGGSCPGVSQRMEEAQRA